MVLKVNIGSDNLITLSSPEYDSKSSSYTMRIDMERSLNIRYQLPQDERYNPEDYQIEVMYYTNVKENDIYQVFFDKKRIGWVFPVQALCSSEHDFSENSHFLPYASVAFRKLLLENYDNILTVTPTVLEDFMELNHFYNEENMVIFVISKKLIEEITESADFRISHFMPNLFLNGYYYNNYHNINSPIVINEDKIRLNLIATSDCLVDEKYINELFTDLLLKETHHLIKFMLLYQAIELLIEKIFEVEFKKIAQMLESQEKKLFAVKEELNKISNEKTRISKLFNTYSSHVPEKQILFELCNELLIKCGENEKNNVESAIYSVRNLIIHQYRNISEEYYKNIDDINTAFIQVLATICSNIKM